jgi:pyruvate kinase
MLQGLDHFDEILREEDGIIISQSHFWIDLPPEKVAFDI